MEFREIRKNANLTQEKLALIMGVDRSTVAKWETGASVPGTDKLLKLAELLGVEVSELIKSFKKSGGEGWKKKSFL